MNSPLSIMFYRSLSVSKFFVCSNVMDPVSVSNYNLNVANDNDDNTLGSTLSLGRYEKRNLKNLLPQITSSLIASSPHVVLGLSLSLSAIMIPQLQDKDSDIQVTSSQASWIASVFVVVSPIGALMIGDLMDRLGRLNTLKWSTIPGIVGWFALIFSRDVSAIIIGRLLLGLSSSMIGPAVVYVTEIARKDMRGSLLSLGPTLVSLGMVLTYIKGWLLGWRMTCWFGLIYQIIPFFLMFLIDESPIYLISKNRTEEARRSLRKLHKHQPQPDHREGTSFADLQLQLLLRDQREVKTKAEMTGGVNKMAEFMKPTGYKPLLILTGLFFFQQFSGIYIFLFNSVQLFEDVGTQWNPYAASMLIGVIRLVMSLVNTWLFKHHKRRHLVMLSGTGMALCTLTSGLFTYLIKNDLSEARWAPVVFLLLYSVFSMVGLLSIPWTMIAELFPFEIRSTAYSITMCVATGIMFIAIQIYANMTVVLGGAAGVQFFFASMSIGAVIFSWLFLPETHGKKLTEIQDYFNGTNDGGNKNKKHIAFGVK